MIAYLFPPFVLASAAFGACLIIAPKSHVTKVAGRVLVAILAAMCAPFLGDLALYYLFGV